MIQIEKLVFNSFQVNTYVVWDVTGSCLVVDPSFYSADERRLFDRFITDKGLKVTGQINTHCHVDHVLGVQHMQSTYGSPFRAHAGESGLVANAPLMGEIFGLNWIRSPVLTSLLRTTKSSGWGSNHCRHPCPGSFAGSLAYYSRAGQLCHNG